jgi:hypothetical protein
MLDYAREKREKRKDAKKIVWILGAMAVVFVMVITRFAIADGSYSLPDPPTKELVYNIAKDFVRPTLKKGNVNFVTSGYKFTSQPDSVYVIRSSAEITDETGWSEKTYFEVVLKYRGGSAASRANWTVLNLDED